MMKDKAIIVVKGGMVQRVICNKKLKVVIIDYDMKTTVPTFETETLDRNNLDLQELIYRREVEK